MVDSFSTKENRYSFEIDDKPYLMGSLTFGDVDEVAEFAVIPAAQQYEFIKKLLVSRTDKRTFDAICKLSIPQVAILFKKWSGLNTGESEASAE